MKGFKHFFAILPLDTPDLRIRGIGIQERMPSGIVDRPAGTGDYLFMFFYDPVVVRGTDGTAWRPAETMVLWQPKDGHYYGNPHHLWRHSWIHLDGTVVSRVLAEHRLPRNQPFDCSPVLVEKTLWDLYEEMTGPFPADLEIAARLLELWGRRMALHLRQKAFPAPIPRRYLDIRRYLETNFDQQITLDALAEKASCSVAHFCSEFKRYFGCSAIACVIRLRMHRAEYLLRNANLSISEIARRVGYEDIYHFSRLFKKYFGLSPRALRHRFS